MSEGEVSVAVRRNIMAEKATFLQMDSDCLFNIREFLTPVEVVNLASTCKHLLQLLLSDVSVAPICFDSSIFGWQSKTV
jgi:F-box domain